MINGLMKLWIDWITVYCIVCADGFVLSRAYRASLECQDRGERTVQRGQRVASDPLVRSDHLGSLERRYVMIGS